MRPSGARRRRSPATTRTATTTDAGEAADAAAPERIRRRVVIRGRVQGVFFRASLERLAHERGVAGSARNLDDGSVEAVLEGPREAVEGMVGFCSRGPSGAGVSQVDVSEENPAGAEGFTTG